MLTSTLLMNFCPLCSIEVLTTPSFAKMLSAGTWAQETCSALVDVERG
jgi:hypothetical protein